MPIIADLISIDNTNVVILSILSGHCIYLLIYNVLLGWLWTFHDFYISSIILVRYGQIPRLHKKGQGIYLNILYLPIKEVSLLQIYDVHHYHIIMIMNCELNEYFNYISLCKPKLVIRGTKNIIYLTTSSIIVYFYQIDFNLISSCTVCVL